MFSKKLFSKLLLMFICILLGTQVALAQEVDLNDRNTVDQIAIAGLKGKENLIDKFAAGVWFLRMVYPAKWNAVKDNEFEVHKAITEASKTFLSLINNYYKKYIDKEGILRLRIKFGKYDFSRKAFPLTLMNENSYVRFYGDWAIVDLVFNNTSQFPKYLPMPTKKAEDFLNFRRSSWGGYNRNLVAIYKYKIVNMDTSPESINSCTIDSLGCSNLNSKVTGHILSIEIYDPLTKQIIYTIPKSK